MYKHYTYNHEVDLVARNSDLLDDNLPTTSELLYTGINWYNRLVNIIKRNTGMIISGFKEELHECINKVISYYKHYGKYPNENNSLYNELYYAVLNVQGTFNNVHYIH